MQNTPQPHEYHDVLDTDVTAEEERVADRGAAMVEYALLITFIAIVAIVAVGLIGETVSTEFSAIDSGLQ